jgi:hypothetical protein
VGQFIWDRGWWWFFDLGWFAWCTITLPFVWAVFTITYWLDNKHPHWRQTWIGRILT